jgi:outer membrane protein
MNTQGLNRTLVALAAVAGCIAPLAAHADAVAEPWLVRVRAVHLDSSNGGSTNPDLGLSINNRWIPEVDISYFFTPEWAAELILTYPQKQELSSSAVGGKIGSFKHLPPTLTLQYHFTSLGAFKPYVGAGVNYTRISSVKWESSVSGLNPKLDSSSVGFALQIGADYEIAKNTYLNIDVKKVQLATDVRLGGSKIGSLDIDPVLIGIGVGWRF